MRRERSAMRCWRRKQMPNDLDHAHTLLFQGKALPIRYARALAAENTRMFVQQTKAEALASRYGAEALNSEARSLAITRAAQTALERWHEHRGCLADDEALDDAVAILMQTIDAEHD